MHLLLTRTEPDARETAERLRARGHHVLVSPMLEIELLPSPETLARPAAILLTSRNAVRALSAWPTASDWREVPVYGVGDGTAEAARAAGWMNVRSASGDAADLARLVIAELPPTVGRLLFCAAEIRQGNLEERLGTAGYEVDTVLGYRAVPRAGMAADLWLALVEARLDGGVFYSRRAAEAFARLIASAELKPTLHRLEAFALSEKVAGGLSGLSFRKIHVARRPDSAALEALIPDPHR